MVATYRTIKEFEDKEELTEEELTQLENYIQRKTGAPCSKAWHEEQLSHAEEILYKKTRNPEEILA